MKLMPQPQSGCNACRDGIDQPFPFSMAFQPIVDVESRTVYAYEALVRGPNKEGAGWVLAQLTEDNRYAFDQSCRVTAITLAAKLNLPATGARLSINFMPGAVYSPASCIKVTLTTANKLSFPLDRLIFEITEGEMVTSPDHLMGIVTEYRNCGFSVALDDVGSGWSGLNLLADLPTDLIKIDMALIRDIDKRERAHAVVKSLVELAHTLKFKVIAEGIETVEEYETLRGCGISLMQGYLLARPEFETLPGFTLPDLHQRAA